MQLVVDANILFAAIIKSGTNRAIMLLSGIDFYAPEFAIQEFKKHLPTLEKKTELPVHEINELFDNLLKACELSLIPFEDFKYKKEEAKKISPDVLDTSYFALALHLNCPI